MKVVNIPADYFPRPCYKFDSEEEKKQFTSFKPGQRVLPAQHFESNSNIEFYFVARHEHGEKGWNGGGYECRDSSGGTRAFYLDALIIHPKEIKVKDQTTAVTISNLNHKQRGRKRTKPIVVKDLNAPKGKRGRKPLDPEVKAQREAEALVKKQNSGGRRGRPKLPDHLKKSKPISTSTEQKRRGRPANPELQLQRQQEKDRIIAAKTALGINIGKGRISDDDRNRIKQWLKNN